MTIKTKYNIGDKVYALHDKVVAGRVELIRMVFDEYLDKPDINYNVRFGDDLYIELEEDLYPTKGELLNSL